MAYLSNPSRGCCGEVCCWGGVLPCHWYHTSAPLATGLGTQSKIEDGICQAYAMIYISKILQGPFWPISPKCLLRFPKCPAATPHWAWAGRVPVSIPTPHGARNGLDARERNQKYIFFVEYLVRGIFGLEYARAIEQGSQQMVTDLDTKSRVPFPLSLFMGHIGCHGACMVAPPPSLHPPPLQPWGAHHRGESELHKMEYAWHIPYSILLRVPVPMASRPDVEY